jgi:hypothetical protein
MTQRVVASVCGVRKARGEMVDVDKIVDVRRRTQPSKLVASIARAVGVSEPRARKCAKAGDLLPEPPRKIPPERGSSVNAMPERYESYVTFITRLNPAVLAPEEFSHIQSSDNRQFRSADSGQCAGSRLPNLCCCYTPLGCIPLTFVACGTASTEWVSSPRPR